MWNSVQAVSGRLRDHFLHASILLPLASILLLTVCVVRPTGNFPLNDDWVYAKAVQGLLEEHRYTGHPFAAASVAAQVVWGAAFCSVFGFSFTVLRVSTLTLALVCAWAVAQCIRETGLSRRSALFGGALVLTNPIFLNLSYTFMTDVPFMAAGALSGLFYLRALKRNRCRDVLLGTIFAIAAFWVRQFGVLIGLAFILTLAANRFHGRGKVSAAHIAACLVPWAVCGAVLAYGRMTGGAGYPWTTLMQDVPLWVRGLLALRYVFVAFVYFGLFLLPVSIARMLTAVSGSGRWPRGRWAFFLTTGLGLDLVACGLWKFPLPLLTNILRDLGTGPLTLRDTYLLNPGTSFVSIGAWWWAVTIPAILSGALILTELRYRTVPAIRSGDAQSGQALFLLLWALLLTAAPYNPYLPVTFDRYLLPPLIPLCILFMGHLPPGKSRPAAWFALVPCVLIYLFSVASLQDYMAWNRARWAAIGELTEIWGADPFEIDGGFEYNGMYTSGEFMKRNNTTDFNQAGEFGWWILDDAYAVSYLPRDGYEELGKVEYFSFLGMQQRSLRMLRRTGHGG